MSSLTTEIKYKKVNENELQKKSEKLTLMTWNDDDDRVSKDGVSVTTSLAMHDVSSKMTTNEHCYMKDMKPQHPWGEAIAKRSISAEINEIKHLMIRLLFPKPHKEIKHSTNAGKAIVEFARVIVEENVSDKDKTENPLQFD